MNEIKAYIPPMAVERVVAQWNFEGGGYVAVVSWGKRPTAELLDAIQAQIDMKRAELAKLLRVGDYHADYSAPDRAEIEAPDAPGEPPH